MIQIQGIPVDLCQLKPTHECPMSVSNRQMVCQDSVSAQTGLKNNDVGVFAATAIRMIIRSPRIIMPLLG